jgi:CheY-like chemotaxis protein
MPTWLIVEDEPDIQFMIKAMFQTWGIDGIAFSDGMEAINWIDACDSSPMLLSQRPDLALIDIRLPGVSGLEVSARLRSSAQLGRAAILLMTAYHLTGSQEKSAMKSSRADRLIYKPLPTNKMLLKLLEDMIKERQLKVAD